MINNKKIYQYKKGNIWYGYYTLEEILDMNLPGDTYIYWIGICPNNHSADQCNHVVRLQKIKNRLLVNTIWKNLGKAQRINLFFILLIFICSVILHARTNYNGKVLQSKIESKIVLKEKAILSGMNSFFDSLKIKNLLPENFTPDFSLSLGVQAGKRLLKANYSYTNKRVFEDEIFDFCSGCYLYSESQSASHLLNSMKYSLEKFLSKNLENAESAYIILSGYADSAPVIGYIPYNGEFGSFPIEGNNNYLTSYLLNGNSIPIKLVKNSKLGNPEIAFLRAYSMKEFLDKEIFSLNAIKKTFAIHAFTENNVSSVGGRFRKVKLQINIVNPSDIEPLPGVDKNLKKLDWILSVLSAVFSIFLLKQMNYHYEHWHNSRRKEMPYRQDKQAFIAISCIVVAFVLFSITWVYPYL